MDSEPTSYRREFLRSPHHAWLGLLTLGAGFISAQPFFLLIGATAYILGWIYLPDMGFFKKWVDRRRQNARHLAEQAELSAFIKKREALLSTLSPERRQRYTALAAVCSEIENARKNDHLEASYMNLDPLLRKLDELMWTYLRLLSLEESLDRFLAAEEREDLPTRMRQTEQELAVLSAEMESLKSKNNQAALQARQRLLDSRLELLEVLRKRHSRIDQAKSNYSLVRSEQERLDQQIKLIRADALAVKNTESLSLRIDTAVGHLDQTNQWISEMDEFKDLVGDLPQTETRVGYRAAPPIITSSSSSSRSPQRSKQTQ